MLTPHLRTRSSGRISATIALAAVVVVTVLFAAAYTLTPDAAAPQADGVRSAVIRLIPPAQAGGARWVFPGAVHGAGEGSRATSAAVLAGSTGVGGASGTARPG